jgi:hypothetical protein
MSNRTQADAVLTKRVNLPAANASAVTASIYLGRAGDPILENAELKVSLPATPDLVDAKTVTVTLKDSADDITFAAIPELATLVVTGAGGAGAAAAERIVRLPSSTRPYVRADVAVLTGGGDNTDVELTLELLT